MDDKVVYVVGAGPGIGSAVARRFAREGFSVGLVARRAEKLAACAAEIRAEGGDVFARVADAGDPAALQQAFKALESEVGPAEVLVYNAAAARPAQPSELTFDHFVDEFRVNVAGALAAAQLVLPEMKKRGRGTMLMTGGGFALFPSSRFTSLSVGKAGLRTLSYCLAEELAATGVYVGTITVAGFVKPKTHFDPGLIAESFWKMYVERPEEHESVYS